MLLIEIYCKKHSRSDLESKQYVSVWKLFVKVQIRYFPDNKSMDCNKTEMADVRLFDCCNLLRFMMNLI